MPRSVNAFRAWRGRRFQSGADGGLNHQRCKKPKLLSGRSEGSGRARPELEVSADARLGIARAPLAPALLVAAVLARGFDRKADRDASDAAPPKNPGSAREPAADASAFTPVALVAEAPFSAL
jgi:hypothetical protein